jgi:hypothetical protein
VQQLDRPGDVLKSNISPTSTKTAPRGVDAADVLRYLVASKPNIIRMVKLVGFLMSRKTKLDFGLFWSLSVNSGLLWVDQREHGESKSKIFKKHVAVKKTVAIVRAPVTRQGFGQLCLQGR